jgi:hypothetical protein
MNKPILSPNFTVDDIHKVREYNYEFTRSMTPVERDKYYRDKAAIFKSKLKQNPTDPSRELQKTIEIPKYNP